MKRPTLRHLVRSLPRWLRRTSPWAATNARDASGWRSPARIRLSDGQSLEDVCKAALGAAPRAIQALGKRANACGSFLLEFRSERVKCYETASPARARMIHRATSALREHGIAIPQIVTIAGPVVFAEWIDGVPASQKPEDAIWGMAEYQSRLHHVPLERLEPGDSDFVHREWLLERLTREGGPHDSVAALQTLCEQIRLLGPKDLHVRVTAPDFIPTNLVMRGDGGLVLVDNEFLAIATGFEFDLVHTTRITFQDDHELARRYLDAYRRHGDTGTLDSHAAFWEILYSVKIAGKRFTHGRVIEGKRALSILKQQVEAYAYQAVD